MRPEEIEWFIEPAPVAESVIIALEAWLRRGLPGDYREFLRRHGGGVPMFADFELEDRGRRLQACVAVFLSADPASDYSISGTLDLLAGRLPRGLLPIAKDAGDDYVCLDWRGPTNRFVVYWHHARAGFPDQVSWVCRSFRGFLDLLQGDE